MQAHTSPAPCLLTETAGPIRWIIASNPGRLNAYTAAMWGALPALVKAAETDPEIRVIVLRGAGEKAFSAGADISEFETNRTAEHARAYDRLNNEAFEAVARAAKPTIAMVHGVCFGGGFELALCCDLRLGDEAALFSVPAAKLGIGYNPRWIKPMLAVVSAAKAKEMLFTGARLSSTEAHAAGILNRVIAASMLEASATALAGEIAANAPLSILAAKRCVDAFSDRPETADLAALDRLVDACFASEDYVEGRRAFMQKRKAVFKGR